MQNMFEDLLTVLGRPIRRRVGLGEDERRSRGYCRSVLHDRTGFGGRRATQVEVSSPP